MKDNGYHGYLAVKTLCCHSPCTLMVDDYPSVSVCHTERVSVCVHVCSCALTCVLCRERSICRNIQLSGCLNFSSPDFFLSCLCVIS